MQNIKTSIEQVIIVEGKSDTARLKKYFNVETIETNGFCLTNKIINEIKTIANAREIIIFTDQDYHGKKLRDKLSTIFPTAKHANLKFKKNEIGVENASKEELTKALANLITYKNYQTNITAADLYELKITNNRKLREKICNYLYIENCNNKRLLQKLELLGINKQKLAKIVGEIAQEN